MTITFQAEPREVLETVVQEPRFQSLTQIPLLAPMELGLVITAFALFGVSSCVYLFGHLPLFAMWIINGCLLYTSPSPRD